MDGWIKDEGTKDRTKTQIQGEVDRDSSDRGQEPMDER